RSSSASFIRFSNIRPISRSTWSSSWRISRRSLIAPSSSFFVFRCFSLFQGEYKGRALRGVRQADALAMELQDALANAQAQAGALARRVRPVRGEEAGEHLVPILGEDALADTGRAPVC